MTTVAVCLDKFRGSATAPEACRALAAGIRRGLEPAAQVLEKPVADGGEGTVDALVAAGYGMVAADVEGPLGGPVRAAMAMRVQPPTAVVEMAQPSGLYRVRGALRPLEASTFGTGQLIAMALDRGAESIVVTAGGSATTDGGAGMLQALGARLLTGDGRTVSRGGAGLLAARSLDLSGLDARLSRCRIVLASDVDNPLLGPNGAAAVFGPQKGASPDEVALLEAALERWADLLAEATGRDLRWVAAAGAAGGLGLGVLAGLSGDTVSGLDFVVAQCGVEDAVRGADLVVVGEGRLDRQSLHGKAPAGVAALARRHGVPVVAVAGQVRLGADECAAMGLTEAIGLVERARGETDSVDRVLELLDEVGAEVASRLVEADRAERGNR